ncbi:hypothetical protein HK098_004540 [Nowakowskiella sp. JEL0407]|nr:hypothetical protein HK098_004540 [Nowakowskiella sp. JEL0407]
MKVASLVVLVFGFTFAYAANDKCDICNTTVQNFITSFEKSDKDFKVSYGHRLNPNGEYRPRAEIDWKKSEIRLLEAFEYVCGTGFLKTEKEDCFELIEDYEEDISKWYHDFYADKQVPELFDYLCVDRKGMFVITLDQYYILNGM